MASVQKGEQMSTWRTIALAAGSLMLISMPVAAQNRGSISGIVHDTSGAVLPGVTIEVASPALIERVRSATSDDSGRYQVVNLDPGTYSVTFSLSGFSTVKRDGIQITSGFTATVNSDLAVGNVSETITVSAASPIVDTHHVVQQQVLTKEVVDNIPSGRLAANLAVLIPGMNVGSLSRGVNQDVGGAMGEIAQALTIHGSRTTDQSSQIDGMTTETLSGIGASYMHLPTPSLEETNIEFGVKSAELETGGVRVNAIPKSGGNEFSGSAVTNFSNKGLTSNNYNDDLKARGLPAPNPLKTLFYGTFGVGGPIVRDRLWFIASAEYAKNDTYIQRYADSIVDDFLYTPDFSQQLVQDTWTRIANGRVTWQASDKHKFSGLYQYDETCQCHHRIFTDVLSAEAANRTIYPYHLTQGTWTSPVTSRLLMEAGVSHLHLRERFWFVPGRGVGPAALDQDTGITIRSRATSNTPVTDNGVARAAVSYVTGSHSVKVGFSYNWQNNWSYNFNANLGPLDAPNTQPDTNKGYDYNLRVLKGVPNQVTFLLNPNQNMRRLPRTAVYVQDQWTAGRATLNMGVRFDQMSGSYNDAALLGNTVLPAQQFADGKVLRWRDVNPRLGVAYDLFGNGRTAVKASVGRFVVQQGTGIVQTPIGRLGTLTRTWNDLNRDFIPQGDPLNPAVNGELGVSPNNNFGKQVFTTRYDQDWAYGTHTRPYQWEGSAGIQHELMPRVGLAATYNRRWYGNFQVTNNQLVSPSDYDTYCITAPLDPRLPGGGGQQICDLWDLTPEKVGQLDNLVGSSATYGKQTEHWSGVDLGLTVRPGAGVLLQGGMSTGKRVTDNCDVVVKLDNPSQYNCHTETPYLTQVKLMGSYRLPYGVDVAGSYQGLPGVALTANYTATNAQIRPSLGRNLSAGANGTVTVNLIPPGSAFLERLSQLDLRFARVFTVGGSRVKGIFDIYNALNSSTVLQWSAAYGTDGSGWVPQEIVQARLMKFELQWEF